jgi:hypothetical protein
MERSSKQKIAEKAIQTEHLKVESAIKVEVCPQHHAKITEPEYFEYEIFLPNKSLDSQEAISRIPTGEGNALLRKAICRLNKTHFQIISIPQALSDSKTILELGVSEIADCETTKDSGLLWNQLVMPLGMALGFGVLVSGLQIYKEYQKMNTGGVWDLNMLKLIGIVFLIAILGTPFLIITGVCKVYFSVGTSVTLKTNTEKTVSFYTDVYTSENIKKVIRSKTIKTR